MDIEQAKLAVKKLVAKYLNGWKIRYLRYWPPLGRAKIQSKSLFFDEVYFELCEWEQIQELVFHTMAHGWVELWHHSQKKGFKVRKHREVCEVWGCSVDHKAFQQPYRRQGIQYTAICWDCEFEEHYSSRYDIRSFHCPRCGKFLDVLDHRKFSIKRVTWGRLTHRRLGVVLPTSEGRTIRNGWVRLFERNERAYFAGDCDRILTDEQIRKQMEEWFPRKRRRLLTVHQARRDYNLGKDAHGSRPYFKSFQYFFNGKGELRRRKPRKYKKFSFSAGFLLQPLK